MLLDILRYGVAYLHTSVTPNWESCFFYPAPPSVSVSRSRFTGFCSGSYCLVTNCGAVPVRCLGFYLVLLSVPGPVICCCLLCILARPSDVLLSGPAVWPGHICICIWSRSCHLFTALSSDLFLPWLLFILVLSPVSCVSSCAVLCIALHT